jgi:hypothetical protein
MRPCQRVGDPSICNKSVPDRQREALLVGLPRVPGGDLEGRAEDLSSYEFRHGVIVVIVLTTGWTLGGRFLGFEVFPEVGCCSVVVRRARLRWWDR